MVYYGFDYVAQIGSVLMTLVVILFLIYLHNRLLRPLFERMGMKERVKMAFYDVELEKFCKENGVDYSKIDVKLDACYKKKNGKLKARLEEIEHELA